MSGSDAPVSAGFRRAFRPGAGGFAAVLGRFFLDPRRALEEVRAQPRLGQASAALLLALLARFQSRWLDGSAQAGDVLRSLGGGFLLWLALAGVWHAAGRAFKKPGAYRTMLCLAAWSATVYWLVLPAAYLASLLPELAWVQRFFRLAAAGGFFYLAWTSLRLNYGWSRGAALAVLTIPTMIAAGLAAAASAVALMAGAVAGALAIKPFP